MFDGRIFERVEPSPRDDRTDYTVYRSNRSSDQIFHEKLSSLLSSLFVRVTYRIIELSRTIVSVSEEFIRIPYATSASRSGSVFYPNSMLSIRFITLRDDVFTRSANNFFIITDEQGKKKKKKSKETRITSVTIDATAVESESM